MVGVVVFAELLFFFVFFFLELLLDFLLVPACPESEPLAEDPASVLNFFEIFLQDSSSSGLDVGFSGRGDVGGADVEVGQGGRVKVGSDTGHAVEDVSCGTADNTDDDDDVEV